MQFLKQNVVAVFIGVAAAFGVYAFSSVKAERTQDPSPKGDLITAVPEIQSCVRNIKVVRSEIRGPKSNPQVEVEVENTGDIGIVAITMSTRKGPEEYGVSLRTGFEKDREQLVVIAPQERAILTLNAENVFKDEPIKIGSVIYADGSDEGCESALKWIRGVRAEEKTHMKPKDPK